MLAWRLKYQYDTIVSYQIVTFSPYKELFLLILSLSSISDTDLLKYLLFNRLRRPRDLYSSRAQRNSSVSIKLLEIDGWEYVSFIIVTTVSELLL